MTLDSLLNFSEHTKITQTKVLKRNNVLKALAGSSWGKEKETLTITFKSICRSIVNYAAPIWSPQISTTNWKNLQVSQNAALRTITGCHLMASIDHLHQETKILPVKPHNELLSRQYLLSCLLPNHVCHNIVVKPQPPRNIKRNIQNTHLAELQAQYLSNVDLNTDSYKILLQELHRDTVNRVVADYKPNRVLDAAPPEVDEAEKNLPRSARTALAQLRSGWCRRLRSYQHRIDPGISDLCPDCSSDVHTVRHLFHCPANPTQLTPQSLWTDTVEVAAFLQLEDE